MNARNLKSGRSGAIGLVVHDLGNPFAASVASGMKSAAREDGATIFVAFTDGRPDVEKRAVTELRGRVDGVILASALENETSVEWLSSLNLPVVCLEFKPADRYPFDSVLVDNRGGSRAAVQLLIRHGHRRIGMLGGPMNTTPGRERYEGYVDALQDAGIPLSDELVRRADFRERGGYVGALSLLELKDPPTAVFAANNLLSMGALQALRERRIEIPRQISFVGFDDIDSWRLLTPHPTVIARPCEDEGAMAMELLLERINGLEPNSPRRLIMPTRLVVRDSVGPPSVALSRPAEVLTA
jgi:DNA-binding LacI/PurR family transcriptional regulator